jgi:invasion protein IalB
MFRFALSPAFAFTASLALAAAGPALAQQDSVAKKKAANEHSSKADAEKSKEKGAPGKPLLVVSFGDWGVYHSDAAKGAVCYTLAQPRDRAPADLKRDPAYAFISDRPSEGVRDEVSFIMGFDVANPPDAAADDDKSAKSAKSAKSTKSSEKTPAITGATAIVGDQSFELVAKAANLWVKNAAKEGQLVDVMRKGSKLEVRAMSKKGNETTDTYSLAGFSQAVERVLKDCPTH